MDRRFFNKYGAPKFPITNRLVEDEKRLQRHASFLLSDQQRSIVDAAIRDVCAHRGYHPYALNVRTTHTHGVIKAAASPEKVIEAFKSYSTRALRDAELVGSGMRIWSRHGSTRYLWRERSLTAAIEYVLYDQGDEFPNFDELIG